MCMTDLLRGCSAMRVRDLLSLDIGSQLRPFRGQTSGPVAQKAQNYLVFARGNSVVYSFGWQQGLLCKDRAIVLNNGTHCEIFAEKLCTSLERTESEGANDTALFDPDFEIAFIERLLQECCESFDRRYLIYRRMLSHVLTRLEEDSGSLLQLVPLRDSLQHFIMEISEAREVLLNLLDNEQDMLDLLLTKRAIAELKNVPLDQDLHDEVEFMLEYFVRELTRTHNDALHLQYRLKTKQELAAISLDVYRNSLLRIDLQISLAGMGLGFATVVTGSFGMNLQSGLEEVHGLFWPATAGCLVGGCAVYFALGQVIRQRILQKHADEVRRRQKTLQEILGNMGVLEMGIERSHRTHQGKVTRHAFETILDACFKEYNMLVSQEQVNLAFQMLDDSGDGFLDTAEMSGRKCREKILTL